MFSRRKVLLAVLQSFGGLGKTQMQKLALLFCQKQAKADYQFIPYKYGGFSFSLAADLNAMARQNQVSLSNKGIVKTGDTDYIKQLKEQDQQILRQIYVLHNNKSYNDLIKYTYTKYPYYAIHSTIADRYLNHEEISVVDTYKPTGTRTTLFTIGYEGLSLEGYLNKLIQHGVRLLVDVRNNPMSMKYGFSKSQLVTASKTVGIEYMHFPEVGIVSEQRQELKTQADYDQLFEYYRLENLTRTLESQQKILRLLKTHNRIALTCFEANICQCHRKHLAEAITQLDEWKYELIHIE